MSGIGQKRTLIAPLYMQLLSIVSAQLIEYGLFGVLLSMPPALLLTLGLKKRNRAAIGVSGACLVSLSAVGLGIVLEGLITGKGLALTRSTLMVERVEQPIFFWVSTAAFGGGAIAIAGLGFYCLWKAVSTGRMAPLGKKSTEPG